MNRALPAAGSSDVAVSKAQAERIRKLERRLGEGLASLAPGRVVRWSLGLGKYIYAEKGPQIYRFVVSADGPFGPIETLSYTVDLDDWKHILVQPDGSLHAVDQSIKALTKRVGRSA